MAKPIYRLVSEIFEEGQDYPAVTHIFRGHTKDKVIGLFRAHLRTDQFLNACVAKGRYANFACREQSMVERWNGSDWIPV